jgi:uncharacterized membrane protein
VSNLALIVLMRAVHVTAAIAWAGAVFIVAGVLVPLARRNGPDVGRVVGIVTQRVGPVIGASGALAVISGLYLFAALHRDDQSSGALILGAGALAGTLSLAVGLFFGRPAGRALAAVNVGAGTEATLQISRLRNRAAASARLMAALLALAILAMATFRFAPALI